MFFFFEKKNKCTNLGSSAQTNDCILIGRNGESNAVFAIFEAVSNNNIIMFVFFEKIKCELNQKKSEFNRKKSI